MQTWKVELSSSGESLEVTHIRRGIFQGYFFCVLASINTGIEKINSRLWSCQGFKVNHLLFMDDLKLFGKNEHQIDSSRVQTVQLLSEDIGTAGVWVEKV